MNYQVLTTSTYAKQILDETHFGVVHSIYRNTINVTVGKHLLALQTKNSPLAPISLITNLTLEQFQNMPFSIGDSIELSLDDHTEVIHLSPEFSFPKQLRQELLFNIRRCIITSHTSGFDQIFQYEYAVEDDLILKTARNRIEAAYMFFKKNDYENACRNLSKLIGLGIGLTPSGDDFLCGLLSGFSLLNRRNHTFTKCLQYYIQTNLKNTNEISRAYLKCALENHFSLAVNILWKNPSHEIISKYFHEIGHSSGIDTLCGIYFAFLLCKE